jgi:hypothetical protein
MYRQLDAAKIVETVVQLQSRIRERFPEAALNGVAAELHSVASESAARAERLGRPYLVLRAGVGLFSLVLVALIASTVVGMNLKARVSSVVEFVQMMESGINDVLFVGAAIFFLFTYEGRLRRERALRAIHELRVLAHIVDMHQLTKDPDRVFNPAPRTPTSPELKMSRFELARYLDYCTEMLSIVSKVGALYVQNLQDPVILEAVDGVEDLTNGLSRKIWQKIMILDTIAATE